MKRIFIKNILLFIATTLAFFSCTTKEEKVREFVEQNVVSQAEEYLICQAIVKYVQEDVRETFENKIKYYASNPYYDYSYMEKDLFGQYMTLAYTSGGIKKKFDERWDEYMELYNKLNELSDNHYIEFIIIENNLKFKSLLKEKSVYSIEEMADIYFKPNHMKFIEITPELFDSIYRSILCLGASTFKYDVVDEIRVKKKWENAWAVDLIYHSGYCMPLEVQFWKEEDGFFVTEAPWIPETPEDII